MTIEESPILKGRSVTRRSMSRPQHTRHLISGFSLFAIPNRTGGNAQTESHFRSFELACAAEFVSNYTPQSGLQRLLLLAHVVAQRFVQKRLVVAATGVVNLLAKPVQNVLVEPDGDAGFSRRDPQDRATPALAEVIFLLHSPSCIAVSLFESPAERRSIESGRRARCKRPQECAPRNPCLS